MRSELLIEGANCPYCLNEVVERLRRLDGVSRVDSSIRAGCLVVDHDGRDTDELVELLRRSVHGVGLASNETVMSPVEPVLTVLDCPHGRAGDAGDAGSVTGAATSRVEADTVSGASAALHAAGYDAEFSATPSGRFACGTCAAETDPAELTIGQVFRFEGDSNPDDEDIVIALTCGCGARGVYTAAYGPSAPAADAAVLRRLAGLDAL